MLHHVLLDIKNLIIYDWKGEVFGKGYLEITSEAVTKHIGSSKSGGGEVKLLNAITEPLTKLVVQVSTTNTTIYLRMWYHNVKPEQTLSSVELYSFTFFGDQIDKGVLEGWSKNDSAYFNSSLIKQYCPVIVNGMRFKEPCKYCDDTKYFTCQTSHE